MLQDTFIIDVAIVQLLSVIFIFVVKPDMQNLYSDFSAKEPDAHLFVNDLRLSRTADLVVAVYVVGVSYYFLKKFLFPPQESVFDKPIAKSASKTKTKLVSLKSLAVPMI